MTFGPTPTITQVLATNEIPMGEVYTPEDGINLIQGGPSSTDALNGKKSAPVAVYAKDGNDVALGTTTQTKATDGTATSWSAIQLLKGILDRLFNGTIAVTGTFFQATQPVSGTFWQATQPVSGAVTATTNADATIGGTTAPAKELLVAGKTNDGTPQFQPIPEGAGGRSVIVEGVAGGTAVPVSGTFYQATQPVSAAALPLPTGAALEAGHLATIDTSTATTATQSTTTATQTTTIATQATNANTALGTPTQTKATDGSTTAWSITQLLKGILDKLLNSVAVTGTFFQATQPVSIADGADVAIGHTTDSPNQTYNANMTLMSAVKGILEYYTFGLNVTPHDAGNGQSTRVLPGGALNTAEAFNNGTVAAGVGAAAVVVKGSAGYLSGVLVTSNASAALNIYDNASAGSGTIIGYIPATATAGQYYPFHMPAANGITAEQASGTPAVTVAYS